MKNTSRGFTTKRDEERSKPFRGFTLIELLVVIAIIGLLSSIVLASLNTARAKANDAKRYSDLHSLETALELYANDHNGQYPAYSGDTSVANSLTSLVPTYIGGLPTDPSPSTRNAVTTTWYRYCGGGGQPYTLLTYPESGSRANQWCSISNGADPCGWGNYPAWAPQCGK